MLIAHLRRGPKLVARPKLAGAAFAGLATALAVIAALGAAPAAAQEAPLESAPVPSLCGHPAGTLTGGVLPGIAPGQGEVRLQPATIARGATAGPQGQPARAVVVRCHRGGAWQPDAVVFYGDAAQLLGFVQLGSAIGSPRAVAQAITLKGRAFRIAVAGIRLPGDPACCGTATARVTVEAKGPEMRVSKVYRHTDRTVAKQVATAIVRRDRAKLQTLTSREIASRILSLPARIRAATLARCWGTSTDNAPLALPVGQRACELRLKAVSGHSASVYLLMSPDDQGALRVSAAQAEGA